MASSDSSFSASESSSSSSEEEHSMEEDSSSTSSSSSIAEVVAVKKRKTPSAKVLPTAAKAIKAEPAKNTRYYPEWDCTKPIPPQFFGCITKVIEDAHDAPKVPERDGLGYFSILPYDLIRKIVNTDPWTRTRFLLCAGNRYLRYVAACLSDRRNVLEIAKSPEIRQQCRNYKEIYNAVARAAVSMDSPWVVLRFLAAAGDCHNYAGNRYGCPMAIACVELRCLEILRIEFKFGTGRRLSRRDPKLAGGIKMDPYGINVSDMSGCMHSYMLRAINLGLENTALGLFHIVKQHNEFIKRATEGQGIKNGGNPITYWPEAQEVRTYLRYACSKGLFDLARYLVSRHEAVLNKPKLKLLIAAPDSAMHVEERFPIAPEDCVVDAVEDPKAKLARQLMERTKRAPQARAFYDWYTQHAPKYKPIPRPPKPARVPLYFGEYD